MGGAYLVIFYCFIYNSYNLSLKQTLNCRKFVFLLLLIANWIWKGLFLTARVTEHDINQFTIKVHGEK